MPPRNLVPKPKQKPHPPLWVACSRRDTILLAARKGIGALSFSFVEPEEARGWVDEYYDLIQSEQCRPAGFSVNPNVAVVVPFMCHRDEQTAIDRGIDGAHFFGYSLAHYYVFGQHRPGRTNLWDEFQRERDSRGFARSLVRASDAPIQVKLLQEALGSLRGAIGTPAQIADLLERYEQAGVDQVIFVSQSGRNRHEHICESIELFAAEVMPRFVERAARREAQKRERLAPAIERALARRDPPRQAPPDYTIWPDHEPWQPGSRRNGHSPRRALAESAFTWFVKGRNDAQLDVIFGSAPGQAMIFRAMERLYAAGHASSLEGAVQYHLTSRRGTAHWVVRVGRDGLSARPGLEAHPTATLSMPAATFARIAAGQQTAASAAMNGRLKMEGELRLVARLGEALAQSTV